MFKEKSFWLALSLYIVLITPVLLWDIDWHLANFWYQSEGGSWALRNDWFTQTILHDGGHDLALALYVILLILYLCSFKLSLLTQYKAGLAYLSLSLPVATLTVSLLKRLTRVDCPWSISDFGGQYQYQSWLENLWSPVVGAGHCFPSGHASSAYMFFGLFFFSRHYWPKKAPLILIVTIIMGLTFGFAQQLRGAHFISHDLTSAFICWLVCWFIWHIRSNAWVKA